MSEQLIARQSSVFEFMNEDSGSNFFRLDHSTALVGSMLQSFTSQDYLHTAVNDRFKRKVAWHRALPFKFADTVDTNCLFSASALSFAQKLAAAPEILQCINVCRQRMWCPSSAACRLQQQSESCFMSALVLHTVFVAHPLFTFCGVIADAVPRLLSWLQRPILVTISSSNVHQIVTIQPQSLDTWAFPSLPLELHTLVRTHRIISVKRF
jgi:hypothetical protein